MVPPAGDVKKIPGFFLSSNTLVPTFTLSPTLTSIVGFMPTKSLDNNETELTVGLSVITEEGLPDIGRFKPFFILITRAMS
jgi:hypothetical protein